MWVIFVLVQCSGPAEPDTSHTTLTRVTSQVLSILWLKYCAMCMQGIWPLQNRYLLLVTIYAFFIKSSQFALTLRPQIIPTYLHRLFQLVLVVRNGIFLYYQLAQRSAFFCENGIGFHLFFFHPRFCFHHHHTQPKSNFRTLCWCGSPSDSVSGVLLVWEGRRAL